MLYICLSFDHELFLGENFVSEKETLIDTTYRILEILANNNVYGTFFTDVCSIMRYEELEMTDFPKLMKEHLLVLHNNGQDIQLHIHSNWFKSTFSENKWNFDVDSYRVQYYKESNKHQNNNKTMDSIIADGKNFLEDLLKAADTEYSCIAFRAGGFCIQPEHELIKCLIDNGLHIDSSVAPGIVSHNTINSYDFTDTPIKHLNWYISPKNGISKPAIDSEKSKMYEVPIATSKRSFFQWLLTKQKYITSESPRGKYISTYNTIQESSRSSFLKIYRKLIRFAKTPVILTLDYFDARVLNVFIKKIIKKYNCRKHDCYISVICHPKLVSDTMLNNMDRFIKLMKSNDFVRFCTMKDIYNKIKQTGSEI